MGDYADRDNFDLKPPEKPRMKPYTSLITAVFGLPLLVYALLLFVMDADAKDPFVMNG